LKQKDYIRLTGVIFAVVTVIHLWRLVSGWDIWAGQVQIPAWVSVVGAVVAGFLAYSSQRLKK
jgi:hypothetical protein